jgi:hypothetical protein
MLVSDTVSSHKLNRIFFGEQKSSFTGMKLVMGKPPSDQLKD